MGGLDGVKNGKVLLTHFALQTLKEPVQDDARHQCRRQIHLYINWTTDKRRICLNEKQTMTSMARK